MFRRKLLLAGAATLSAGAVFRLGHSAATPAAIGPFAVERTEEDWRRLLTPAQFRVLREHGTERPGSSPLDREHRAGLFACAGCEQPLYRSDDKFDSRTGWPSFTQPIAGATGTAEDWGILGLRTEVHCARCGGHLGHVFADGPPPTGTRHCLNGDALAFRPA